MLGDWDGLGKSPRRAAGVEMEGGENIFPPRVNEKVLFSFAAANERRRQVELKHSLALWQKVKLIGHTKPFFNNDPGQGETVYEGDGVLAFLSGLVDRCS